MKWYKRQGATIRAAIIGGLFAILAAVLVGVFELLTPNPPVIVYLPPTAISTSMPTPTIEVDQTLNPIQITLTPIITITPTSINSRVLYEADFSLWSDEAQECAEFEFVSTEKARHVRLNCLHTDGSSTLSIGFLDFDLRLTAQKVSGSNRAWYGIVLTSERDDKHINHRFMISGLGTYTYEVATFNNEGEQIDLEIVVPSEISPAIIPKEGTNFIQIIRKRAVIEFRVNDQTLLVMETSVGGNEEIKIGPGVITQNQDEGGDDFVDIAFKELILYEVP